MSDSPLYGALEAGGTKMVLSVLNDAGELLERTMLPTRTPGETIPEMIDWFRGKHIAALGIGCFGPLDLLPASPTFGSITATPKPGWQNVPVLDMFKKALGVPAAIDTDVNAAALAEARLGAAKGLSSCLYVTVGTGIGGGLIIHGQPVHGLVHPELGHMLLQPDPRDPAPKGFCPYHTSCLEGLASGPALQKRWGVSARELAQDHIAWEIESTYLAQMCVNAICCFSPEKIILGGGVMQQSFLLPMIRSKTKALLNNYIVSPALNEGLDDYITAPGLDIHSGVTGAFLLAKQALAAE